MSNDNAGMQVLMQAAEILRRHGARVRYESKLTGRVAGEREAMKADVWDEAAEKVEGLARDAH